MGSECLKCEFMEVCNQCGICNNCGYDNDKDEEELKKGDEE